MSRCDRDLWPLDLELLQNFGVMCINSVQNLREIEYSIDDWVIDDLARFATQF